MKFINSTLPRLTLLVSFSFLLIVIPSKVIAQKIWVGISNDWNDVNNWSPKGLPTLGDSVIIDGSVKVSISSVPSAKAKSLYIGSMASLEIQSGRLLNFNTGARGINNLGLLTCSGTINFRKPLAEAIINDSLGTITVTSSGIINVDTSGATAIVNSGAFTNSGLVDIDSSASRGILNYQTATFVNDSRLYFTDISADGILNTGALTNGADGIIYISTAHDDGLDNSGTITNLNSIIIENVDDNGVWNGGKFINDSKGIIAISDARDDGLVNSNADTLQNNGQIYITKSQDGITNSGLLTNSNSIIVDSIDINGVFNFGTLYNEAQGSIFVSYTEGNGMENIAGFKVRNYGEIDIKNTGESCLENSGTIENHNLMKFGYSSLSSVHNKDSIYNGPTAVLDVCCNDATFGFANITTFSAITNDGFLDVSGSQPIYNEGSINNNGKTLVDGFNSEGIINLGIINNKDSIIIRNGWTGLFNVENHGEIGLLNDGYFSASELGGSAINIRNGEFINNGIIEIDDVGIGMDLTQDSPGGVPLFHNLDGASISISEARDYGLKLGEEATYINESGSLLHIINTTETPMEVDSSAIFDGLGEIIIED